MIRFYKSQYPAENVVIEAAYEGCPEEKFLTKLGDYQPSDVAVVMGVYKKRVPASYPRGEVIREQNIKADQEVTLTISKKPITTGKDLWGTFKFKKSTEQLMREVDKDFDVGF